MTGQPGRREELLAELDEAFAGLQATCRDLPEARKRLVMQGTWSVKDILVHIAGWHREMAGALTRIARGERAVPEGGELVELRCLECSVCPGGAGGSRLGSG